MRGLFAATVALGAFLLFLVQPLVGKYILPWFGGAPSVWVACMLFFQAALLAGYVYAHALTRHVPGRAQAGVHVVLLGVAVALAPIAPSERWRPIDPAADPTGRILLMLLTSVGLPFVLVSATTPLVQTWWGRARGTGGPYRLYAVSNLASFAALLAYPVLVEPYFARRGQAVGWSVAFGLYALLAAAAAAVTAGRGPGIEPARRDDRPAVAAWAPAAWVVLPAVGVMLMLGTTSRIGQEVAPVPLLWVVPLGLYLLTYVWAFARGAGYRWGAWASLFGLGATGVAVVALTGRWIPTGGQLLIYLAAMFAGCMVCHGEVARLQPPASFATAYYVALAAGGAVGGVFVGLVAPGVFTTHAEYPLALILCMLVAGVRAFADPASRLHRGRPAGAWLGLVTGGIVVGWLLLAAQSATPGDVIDARRNFYGSLRVVQEDVGKPTERRSLRHGRVIHGTQLTIDAAARRRAPTYYGPTCGVGQLLERFRADAPRRRVGVIGLGIGSIAAWARTGDTFRFYEINPDVRAMADQHFTALKDCPGRIEHAAGDARRVLEDETDQQFDVLVVDAFAGDAIPVHLLTREAFAVYRRHLAPGGVLAVHVTNRHLDLRPVVRAGADSLGFAARWFHDFRPTSDVIYSPSDWMALGADEAWIAGLPNAQVVDRATPWTDEAASLFPLLR